MKIDETTGLPELPEGYFWRVYGQVDDGDYWYQGQLCITLQEQYMRKRLWRKDVEDTRTIRKAFLSKKTYEEVKRQGSTDDSIVRGLARGIMLDEKDKLEWETFTKKYVGDYPPNKLGE